MLIHNVTSTIPCLFILMQLISIPTQSYKRSYKHISNSPFTHLFLLIICEITMHTPLKYRILYLKHAKMYYTVYNLRLLYAYKANFITASRLKEMLLTDKHTASISQTFHLFSYSYL